MKIIVAGGGTGGHIIPNIAVLDALKKLPGAETDVLYIGSRRGMEADMIPALGWKFRGISCGKLRRYFSLENILDGFRTLAGIMQSIWIIREFRADVIFSKGGYVSLPVALAGGILGVPVIVHESDAQPGLATKIAAKFAKVICISYEESRREWGANDGRIVLTGNPVRAELAHGVAEKGWKLSRLSPGKPVILVMGGSQGAQYINDLIEKNLAELLKEFQIIHICGKGKVKANIAGLDGYFSVEFLGAELKDIYAITDLVISRSGANSLAEIAYLGLPAVLIPLVIGSRGDQIRNAEIFALENTAVVLDETDFHGNIMEVIRSLFSKSTTEKARRKPPEAAIKIAEIIISYKNEKSK